MAAQKPGGGQALEGPAAEPLPPEPSRDAGPHDAPSPDPQGRRERRGRRQGAGDAGSAGEKPSGVPKRAEDVSQNQGDTIHLEDDRVRYS